MSDRKRRLFVRWTATGPGSGAVGLIAARAGGGDYHCSLWLWWGFLKVYWMTEIDWHEIMGTVRHE